MGRYFYCLVNWLDMKHLMGWLMNYWNYCQHEQHVPCFRKSRLKKGVQQFFSSIANNFETFKVWLMVSYGFMRFDDIWLYQGVRFLVAWWVDRMVLKCLRFSHFHGYSKWKVSNLAHWVSPTVPGGNQKPLPGMNDGKACVKPWWTWDTGQEKVMFAGWDMLYNVGPPR